MAKPVFVTFDLKPQDFFNLNTPDTRHLLNHSTAWLDEKIQEVQTDDKHQIIRIVLLLLGMLFILFGVYVVFTQEYFKAASFSYLYTGILLGSIILSPTILSMKRRPLLRAIEKQQKAMAVIKSTNKPLRFHFFKDHIPQLLSPQAQALVWNSLQDYKNAQGIQALLWFFLAFLALGCTIGIHNYVYFMNPFFPFGRLVRYMDNALIVQKFLWLLTYGAIFAAVFSINLFVRQFLEFIKTPTK